MTEVVDLTAFLPQDTGTLSVLKPGSTEPTGWTVTFGGPSHPKTIAYNEKVARKSLYRSRAIEQAQVNGKKYKADEREPEDARRENVEWVVARIVDWSPVALPGGEPIHFSEASATELLLRPEMGWAYVQMVEYLADEKSFTKRSVTA